MILLGDVHNAKTNRNIIRLKSNIKGRIMNNTYVILLKNIGYILWKNLRKHPLSMVKIGKLGFSLKSSIQNAASDDKKVRIESTMEIVESVLEFRQSNPKDFDVILNALSEFVQEYKNPDTNEAIMKILLKETEVSDDS